MESILNLGNQCKSDNAFTKKARLLQSMYRVKIGEEESICTAATPNIRTFFPIIFISRSHFKHSFTHSIT